MKRKHTEVKEYLEQVGKYWGKSFVLHQSTVRTCNIIDLHAQLIFQCLLRSFNFYSSCLELVVYFAERTFITISTCTLCHLCLTRLNGIMIHNILFPCQVRRCPLLTHQVMEQVKKKQVTLHQCRNPQSVRNHLYHELSGAYSACCLRRIILETTQNNSCS